MVSRDLILDDLGNYYQIKSINKNKITLVNAIVFYAYNRILNDDYYEEYKGQAVAAPATKIVKNKIKKLENNETKGRIYNLTDVSKKYVVVVDGLYEREISVNN